MKNLDFYRKEFMREALEYDLGKKEEDFHSYLRHHNLEHHLSETQIVERNRENNKLNSLGLVMGVGVPLSLGAIYGIQKLTNDILIGHGKHNFREPGNIEPLKDILKGLPSDYPTSLSGFNTRYMPTAPAGIDKDIIPRPRVSEILRAEEKFKLPTQENILGGLQSGIMGNIRSQNIGISPPTSLL